VYRIRQLLRKFHVSHDRQPAGHSEQARENHHYENVMFATSLKKAIKHRACFRSIILLSQCPAMRADRMLPPLQFD
jgi:hypothetical protein